MNRGHCMGKDVGCLAHEAESSLEKFATVFALELIAGTKINCSLKYLNFLMDLLLLLKLLFVSSTLPFSSYNQ